ncbi:MAG: single-stranded DNA-binding protein [Candidatus Nanopelagicales bacterium]|jgi:single-strand DNA-binding protein|nr:single-stranded DNA-binding protein [Actinomycetota bacterium]MDP4746319.1 single-stranded DNA-binding protein [Candidatus Nanopelagicales bacterium]MDP4986482.1 single-stranded DNA-binding protein [Candidatus Nanopelagicales bacterium]
MNDIFTTVIGNAVTDVSLRTTTTGVSVASFRIASNPRRFDKATNSWIEQETNFLTITAWSQLAENVALSVHKGQSLVVSGKLKVRQWQDGEKNGTSVEIDAVSIGHDLNRGTSEFTKIKRVSENFDQDPWVNEVAETGINAA